MSLEAINEQLLRAVGVGVALFGRHDRQLIFANAVFESWFDGAVAGSTMAALFPALDQPLVDQGLDANGIYSTETQLRKRRRTLVIAQTFRAATVGSQELIVLECQNISRIRELEAMIESYSAMVERNTHEIRREKERVERLLLNIMPKRAMEEYRSLGVVTPQKYDAVSVLVLDFVDFAETIDALAPTTFVSELNELYTAFDRIGEQFGCERIKTTGDTYLCVAGFQAGGSDHAEAVAMTAIRFLRFLKRRNESTEIHWRCRIGLGTGPVVGSVVGVQKYAYDVFGYAVNLAYNARSRAVPMEVLAAPETVADLGNGVRVIEPSSARAAEDGFVALATD